MPILEPIYNLGDLVKCIIGRCRPPTILVRWDQTLFSKYEDVKDLRNQLLLNLRDDSFRSVIKTLDNSYTFSLDPIFEKYKGSYIYFAKLCAEATLAFSQIPVFYMDFDLTNSPPEWERIGKFWRVMALWESEGVLIKLSRYIKLIDKYESYLEAFRGSPEREDVIQYLTQKGVNVEKLYLDYFTG